MTRKAIENSARFQRFSEEWLRTGNAYQSAIAAGYSRQTAKSKSYRLAARVRAQLSEQQQLGDPQDNRHPPRAQAEGEKPAEKPKVSYVRLLNPRFRRASWRFLRPRR